MEGAQRLIAGAMSGTSADGVDVALVQITGRGTSMSATLLQHHHKPYEPALRDRLFVVRSEGSISLAELAGLGREISLRYGEAVNETLRKAHVAPADVVAVAAHGQTLFHDPPN